MFVAVIGNYQSNNLGDDMYVALLKKRYPDHRFYPQHLFPKDTRPHFIIYGGGGVLRENEGRRDLLHGWRKEKKTPYCVVSVGAGMRDGSKLTFKKHPFPQAEFITVRDEASAAAIKGAELVPDLAWTFEPETTEKNGDEMIGVMLRHSHAFDSFELVETARMLMNTNRDSDFLFFSTYGERLGAHSLAHPTRAGYRSTYRLYNGYEPIDYLSNYLSCKRVIAMPLHGIIFAAIYGVPWAAWSYSDKVTWLADELDAHVSMTLNDVLVFNHTPRRKVIELRAAAERHFELLDKYLK